MSWRQTLQMQLKMQLTACFLKTATCGLRIKLVDQSSNKSRLVFRVRARERLHRDRLMKDDLIIAL
jgi:hypothetical protein